MTNNFLDMNKTLFLKRGSVPSLTLKVGIESGEGFYQSGERCMDRGG